MTRRSITRCDATDAALCGKPFWAPGPWTIQEARGEAGELLYHSIHAPPSAQGFADYIVSTWGAPHAANARLIAAAPKIADALGGLLRAYLALVDSGDCGAWNPRNDEPVKAAFAALADAKGVTPP